MAVTVSKNGPTELSAYVLSKYVSIPAYEAIYRGRSCNFSDNSLFEHAFKSKYSSTIPNGAGHSTLSGRCALKVHLARAPHDVHRV